MNQAGNKVSTKGFFETHFSKIKLPALLIVISLISCKGNEQPGLTEQPSQIKITKPGKDHKQVPIWPVAVPDSELVTGPEIYHDEMVSNVSHPTVTVYSPQGKNTGAAVIVFPGGGYKKLAVEMEGSEICEWLASVGVTGILLKYRVPDSGPHYDKDCHCQKDPERPIALQDAQRAVGLVRFNAAAWNIDPHKIGVMGFSAGGHLVADVSTNYRKRAYPVTDEADKMSCRPDFGIAFYPGHMTFHTNGAYELNRTIPVDKETPPMFILQAGNDPVDSVQNSLVYYIALKKAGVPAEYHVYAEGGHAFGLKRTSMLVKDWAKLPIADWPRLVETWLHTIKMIAD